MKAYKLKTWACFIWYCTSCGGVLLCKLHFVFELVSVSLKFKFYLSSYVCVCVCGIKPMELITRETYHICCEVKIRLASTGSAKTSTQYNKYFILPSVHTDAIRSHTLCTKQSRRFSDLLLVKFSYYCLRKSLRRIHETNRARQLHVRARVHVVLRSLLMCK